MRVEVVVEQAHNAPRRLALRLAVFGQIDILEHILAQFHKRLAHFIAHFDCGHIAACAVHMSVARMRGVQAAYGVGVGYDIADDCVYALRMAIAKRPHSVGGQVVGR